MANFLNLRSFCKFNILNRTKVQNIYHATVQKTGSQWLKAVFSDKRIQQYTGLKSYPQHRYEFGEFKGRFPKYTFVPGLYIPYGLYEEIKKPKNYKTIYIFRDPRDIIVSWYYSMLKSHRPSNNRVVKHRERLKSMSKADGIAYCIKEYSLKLAYMRSWAYHSDNPNVIYIKCEELFASPLSTFKNIFKHCQIAIPDCLLKEVLDDYTKEKMRKRDIESRNSEDSNYGKNKMDWKITFTQENLNLFYEITGNLVELLGYKK